MIIASTKFAGALTDNQIQSYQMRSYILAHLGGLQLQDRTS